MTLLIENKYVTHKKNIYYPTVIPIHNRQYNRTITHNTKCICHIILSLTITLIKNHVTLFSRGQNYLLKFFDNNLILI